MGEITSHVPNSVEGGQPQKIATTPMPPVIEVHPLKKSIDELRTNIKEHTSNITLIQDTFGCKNITISDEEKQQLDTNEGMTKLMLQINEFKENSEELTPLEYLQQSEYINKALSEIIEIKSEWRTSHFIEARSRVNTDLLNCRDRYADERLEHVSIIDKIFFRKEIKECKKRQIEIQAEREILTLKVKEFDDRSENYKLLEKEKVALQEKRQKTYNHELKNEIVVISDVFNKFIHDDEIAGTIDNLVAELNTTEDVVDKKVAEQDYKEIIGSLLALSIRDRLPDLGDWRLLNEDVVKEINNNDLLFRKKSDNLFGNRFESWQEIRSSNSIKEIFGDAVQTKDQAIYERALENSLKDTQGQDIRILKTYPTPDAIRNLALIACADAKLYRTGHANVALYELKERTDWKKILNETIEKYPELATTCEFLENIDKNIGDFHYSDNSNIPGIRGASFEFLLKQSQGKNKNIVELAFEGIPLKEKIAYLKRKEIIEKSDFISINELMALKTDNNSTSLLEFKNHINDHFDVLIKNSLNVDHDTSKTTNDTLKILHKFDILSKELLLFNNLSKNDIEWLAGKGTIAILENDSLSVEDTGKLLEILNIFNGEKVDFRPYINQEISNPNWVTDLSSNLNKLAELSNSGADKFLKHMDAKAMKGIVDNDLFSIIKKYNIYNDLEYKTSGNPIILSVLNKIVDGSISKERADELPSSISFNKISTSSFLSLAAEHSSKFLATDQGCKFFKNILNSFPNNKQEIEDIANYSKIAESLIFDFPKYANALMKDDMREIKLYIYEYGDTLLKDTTDISFLNTLVGEFGKKSGDLIKGYKKCLAESNGQITTDDKQIILEFVRQLRVIAPQTILGYKKAKETGHEKVFITQLKALAERMTGSGFISDEDRKNKYYQDLLRHVYSNNTGDFDVYEGSASCPDRSSDLVNFKIKPRYEIDLLSQNTIRIKDGEKLDPTVKEGVEKQILDVAGRMNALGFDKEKNKKSLSDNIDKIFQEILDKGGLNNIEVEAIKTSEEKLFLILTDSIYGGRTIDRAAVKDLIITYEFTNFEDISDYIKGTTDRVSRANNQNYALLCELETFFSDRIKEVNRGLIEAAWNNPAIKKLMPEYFKKLGQEENVTQQEEIKDRLQVDKLGVSEGFLEQAGRVLEKRFGKKFTPDEITKIIRKYEAITDGLTEKSSNSKNKETKAFYGQLRSQREKTFTALKVITGEEINSKETHLGEVDLQQMIKMETSIGEGKYDEEQFATYTVQRFIDLFEDEKIKIDRELDKFESLKGTKREVLYGYITKNKESAKARMVGGVCVAVDNPGKFPNQNIWELPNYFQMVFQEPDTLQCQGLVLMHHFDEGGKKILSVSPNPSSTYLYSVDETALFEGIMTSIEGFATENNFDMIVTSKNPTIRTNRTGGEFEKAFEKRIKTIDKEFTFDELKTFSHHPRHYQIQEMDVLWTKDMAQK